MESKLPSILDKEIANKDEDLFGHIHYAEALFHLINENKPPFTIGLLGKWGTGKSSIKELSIKHYLNDINKFKIINFNAWRYESSDVRRALLRHIYISLEGNEEQLYHKLYNHITELFKKEKTPKEIAMEIYDKYIWSLSQFGLIFFCTFKLFFFIVNNLHIQNSTLTTILASFFSIAASTTVKYLFGANSLIISRYTNNTRVTNPIISSEQFEEELKTLVEEFEKPIINRGKKIVVFIDDLDRLPTHQMVAGIDAVRVFLDNPNNKIVFILSCDENNIFQALLKEKELLCLKEPDIQKQYLDRIFQFRVEIPYIETENLLNLADQCILYLEKDKKICFDEEFKQALPSVLERLIHLDVKNPRTAKQLLNTFLQSYWIAKKREQQCKPCNKVKNISCKEHPCLLGKKTITNNLQTLAVITVFKVDFPDFYNDFSKEPDLLRFILLKTFNIKNDYLIESDLLYKSSEKFFTPLTKTLLENETERQDFSLADKRLHFYLSSIRKMPFPNDLRPFIALFEDSLSREIGMDIARPIYKCLATGELSQLKQLLKVKSDEKLSESYTEAIYKTYKEINKKLPEPYKKEADYVVGNLINHFHSNYSKQLLQDLAQSLFNDLKLEKHDLLECLGNENIKVLLLSENISKDKVLSIFSILITYHSAVFEKNNLSHFIVNKNWSKALIEIGLHLFSKNYLKETPKQYLFEIVRNRTYVKISQTVTVTKERLSFTCLESWLKEFNDKDNELLYGINFSYVSDCLDVISKSEQTEQSIEFHINNFKLIFDKFIEKDRKQVIDKLSSCLIHKHSAIVNFAVDYIKENNILDKLNSEELNNVISSVAYKLNQNVNEDEDSLENIEKMERFIVELFNQKIELIFQNNDYDTANILKTFIQNCSKDESKVNLVLEIFDNFYNHYQEKANELLDTWVKTIFVNEDGETKEPLHQDILKMIEEKYLNLDSVNKYMNSLASTLEAYIEDEENELEPNILERYTFFIKNLPENLYNQVIIKTHISNVYSSLYKSLTQGTEYFEKIFPIIAPIMKYVISDELDDLFIEMNKYLEQPDIDEILFKIHSWMENNWIKINANLPNYRPQEIVNNSVELIKSKGSNIEQNLILTKSIYFMYKQNIIENNYDNQVNIIRGAFKFWENKNQLANDLIKEFPYACFKGFNFYILARRTDNNSINYLKEIWGILINKDIAPEEQRDKTLIGQTEYIIKETNIDTYKAMWLSMLFDEYKNLNIFYQALFNLIKEDKRLMFKESRIRINKQLNTIFKDDYSKIAKDFAKFLFTKEVYFYNSFYGSERNRLLEWIQEFDGSVIDKTSTRKLLENKETSIIKAEIDRIIKKYPNKKRNLEPLIPSHKKKKKK